MKKVIKIRYRKQNEKETAPWQQLNNIDESVWDGRYDIRVENHDISINLPFAMNENETATLIVEDYSHNGKLQHSRTIVQTISKVEQEDGKVLTYSRTYYKTDDTHKWSEWRQGVNTGDGSSNEYKITWNTSSHIDTYTTAGVYNITGEHTNAADGLPIANASPGYTFHARLIVLDCSIPGNGQADDKCITQMLMLSNRTGGDGDVYVRTGRAANKNQLAGGNGWEPWGKLQQNIEVGQVTSLNDLTGNGVYSGVYTNDTTLFETFVMVVINNYAVADATGNIRSISQFKYALGTDGTFSYKTRTGQGNTGVSWGEWVDLGAATTSDIQDGAITVQKLSADIRTKVENPLRPLFIATGAEYNDSGTDKTKSTLWGESITHKAGHYCLNGLGDITEEQMLKIFNRGHFNESEKSALGYSPGGVNNIRTNLCRTGLWNGTIGNYLCMSNSVIEVLTLHIISNQAAKDTCLISIPDADSAFSNATKLSIIDIRCNLTSSSWKNSTFLGCINLKELHIHSLKSNIFFQDCPDLSKASLMYMIEKAAPTTAIAITLHPDAYTLFADDANIIALLEAQPLVSLVSA